MSINLQNQISRTKGEKGLHSTLSGLSLTDASRLPSVPSGEYLVEGDVYLDLADPARGPFRAMKWQCAGSQNRYIPAAQLPAAWWDLLVRMTAYTSLAATARWATPGMNHRS
jgi:hypothetical protein